MTEARTRRGTSNKNVTGSSMDRRARRQFLLDTFGDGVTCPCYRCREPLTLETLTVDRIRAGMDGGTYVRGNIRPACSGCNIETGNRLQWHRRRFPYLGLVRFKSRAGSGANTIRAWTVIAGESEKSLTLMAVKSGRILYSVDRDRLEHIPGMFYTPERTAS